MRNVITASIVTLILPGMASMKAMAAEPVIDGSAKGSLTIHKYAGDALEHLEEYSSRKDMAEAVKNAGDTLKPLKGVVFRYAKIGDVNQYTKDGTIAAGYSVDAGTTAFLELTDSDAETEISGKAYYNTTTLTEALEKKTQAEIESGYAPDNFMTMRTDADGTAKASELPVGLYLVYEYSYPSEVSVTTRPFFVSIPVTENGKEWVYDVEVYPKNQTESVAIDKCIVSDHGETKKTDARTGEEITFKITADVPGNIGKMKTYVVRDTLGEGLSFVKEGKVYGVKDETKEELINAFNYTSARNGQNLTYTFTPVSLADNNRAAMYDHVEITYTGTLNEKACTGTENVNQATLTYSRMTNVETDATDGTVTTDPVKASVYTYAIDLLKYGNGDVTRVLKGVTFQLLDENKKERKVAEKEGVYYLDNNGKAVLTTDQDGKIYVKGLGTGTYYLRELQTSKGYNLLKDDIEIQIRAEEGTYQDVSTRLKVKSNYSMTNGKVNLKVNNTKGFLLPATGGAGAVLFFVTGVMLVIAGVCSFRISMRKREGIAE